jgi:hypothetical protein
VHGVLRLPYGGYGDAMLDGSQSVAAQDFDLNIRTVAAAPPPAWTLRHSDNHYLRRQHAGCGGNGIFEASIYAAHVGIKVCD